MTSSEEPARQMRSPSLFLPHDKLEQYPKPLYLKSRACIYKLESVLQKSSSTKESNHLNLSTSALGIDIAKAKFDVCLIEQSGKAKHKIFANTRHGFEQLVGWLSSHQVAELHACLEATGSYGEPLLRTRGKSKMTVIGAARRKLIHLAYGVLKTGKPFDPNWAKSA